VIYLANMVVGVKPKKQLLCAVRALISNAQAQAVKNQLNRAIDFAADLKKLSGRGGKNRNPGRVVSRPVHYRGHQAGNDIDAIIVC
jgi:hypothetical protein